MKPEPDNDGPVESLVALAMLCVVVVIFALIAQSCQS